MAQRGVPVSAAAAALGHDPAIFFARTHTSTAGDLRAVADAMELARLAARESAATGPADAVARVDVSGTTATAEYRSGQQLV
jgi:hypothetical protein